MIRFDIEDTDGAKIPLYIRPMSGSDINYVRSSWFNGYKNLAKCSKSVFAKYHPKLIDELLASPDTTTVIVSSDAAPTMVHAWACGEMDGPVHWCNVDMTLRGRGVAREMMKAVIGGYPNHIDVTHRFIGRVDSRRFTFNPYILRVNA